MLPIGPPDPDARLALWWRACEQAGATDIELTELVEASGDFAPARRQGCQQVALATFEATVGSGARVRATTRDTLQTQNDSDGRLFARIRERVAVLAREDRQHQEKLRTLEAEVASIPLVEPALLDDLPTAPIALSEVPEAVLRPFFESCCGCRSATTAVRTRQPAR